MSAPLRSSRWGAPTSLIGSLTVVALLFTQAPVARAGDPTPESYWTTRSVRPFFMANAEVGFLYLKTEGTLGYGRPFDTWAGLEISPLISFSNVGLWGGLHLAIPFFELRAGVRYQHSFRRSLLLPKDHYERYDIEDRGGLTSRHLSLEIKLSGGMPMGPGKLLYKIAATEVRGVEPGYFVFEETIRVVVAPPYVWRASLGYIIPVALKGALRLGVLTEVVGVPGRNAYVVRGGAIAQLRLFRNLDARATLMPVLESPDALGAAGSEVYRVGLIYHWATGEPFFQ